MITAAMIKAARTDVGADVTAPPPQESIACGATARLVTELDLPAAVVRPVVRDAFRDLAGVPAGALPELVERLARERLPGVRHRRQS